MVKIIDANTGEFTDLSLGGVAVTTPILDTSSAISGQITVTSSGTAVQGSDVALTNGVFLKGMAANTGKVYVGASGVTILNGFEMSAGDLALVQVENLNELWFNATVNGSKICWIKG